MIRGTYGSPAYGGLKLLNDLYNFVLTVDRAQIRRGISKHYSITSTYKRRADGYESNAVGGSRRLLIVCDGDRSRQNDCQTSEKGFPRLKVPHIKEQV